MADLIDRAKAIKAIEDMQDCYNGFSSTYDKAQIIGVLEDVPTAEPQITKCKDCRYWDRNIQFATLGVCHIWGETERTRNDYCSEARKKHE